MLNKIQKRYLLRQKKKIMVKCNHQDYCRCKRKVKWIRNKIEANIPLKYILYGFKDMNAKDVKEIKISIQLYVKKLHSYFEEGTGYYLSGKEGLGKTAFGTIALSYALSKGYSIHYEEFTDLIEFYTRAWDKQGNERDEIKADFVESIYESDFLMIDGLGQEIPSKININILERVVRTRVNYNLPTIYASRLPMDIFCENHLKSKALLSLLTGSVKEVNFEGKDYRKEKQKK